MMHKLLRCGRTSDNRVWFTRGMSDSTTHRTPVTRTYRPGRASRIRFANIVSKLHAEASASNGLEYTITR